MESLLFRHDEVPPTSASKASDGNRKVEDVERRGREGSNISNNDVEVEDMERRERERPNISNNDVGYAHSNKEMEMMAWPSRRETDNDSRSYAVLKQGFSHDNRSYIHLKHGFSQRNENDSHNISLLFWNRYHSGRKWWHVPDEQVNHRCGKCSCSFIYDDQAYHEMDAVLFDFNKALLENYTTSPDEDPSNLKLPSPRITEQYWILYNNEPAHNEKYYTRLHNSLRADVFNLSATYRNEADIVLKYGKCKKRNLLSLFKRRTNYTEKKAGLVIWLVSNCNASSNRLEYAQELQKFISVDIGGRCGERGSRKIFGEPTFDTPLQSLNKYKFYLAFENTFCDQYITEKVFKMLDVESHVVPIVRGAGPYKGILPPGSYIDTADFSSPKHLAAYLHHLDKNDELYNEYFIARDKYICHNDYADGYSWPCAICNKVCNLKRKGTRKTLDQDEIDQLYLPSNLCNYP